MKAVPTVCLALLQHLEATQQRLKHLRLICVGGSACPPSTIQARSLSGPCVRGVDGVVVRRPSCNQMMNLSACDEVVQTLLLART